MNRRRAAIDRQFKIGRKIAFAEADGECVKCGTGAVETHHVYGPDDNQPAHLRPLCFRCHLVAPSGDAYWEWERSGKSGVDMARDRVMSMVRQKMPDMPDDEFERLFTLAYPMATIVGRFMRS